MPAARRFSLSFKPHKKAASKPSTKSHHVTFKEKYNTVHEGNACVDVYDNDLLYKLWHQRWEMSETKDDIKLQANQWRKTGMGVFLHDIFHCKSINNDDLSPTLCQKQLTTFAQLPDELHMRGLERYLSQKHDEERTTNKRNTIGRIVYQSEHLKAQVKLKQISQAESDQALADFCQQINRDAQVFAARLGHADQVVAQQGCAKSTSSARRLVEYKQKMASTKARGGGGHPPRKTKVALKTAPATGTATGLRLPEQQARQA